MRRRTVNLMRVPRNVRGAAAAIMWRPARIVGGTVGGVRGRRHSFLRLDQDGTDVIGGNVDGVSYACDTEHTLWYSLMTNRHKYRRIDQPQWSLAAFLHWR